MPNRKRRALGALLALVLCALMVPGAATAETVTIKARDNGRTINLNEDDRLQLKLGSCEGSCGYTWKFVTRPNPLLLRLRSSRLSGLTRTWTYEASSAGRTSLRMAYTPPGRRKATRFYSVKVRITAPRCRPSEQTDDVSLVDSDAQALLYSGTRGGDSVLFGCDRASDRVTTIFSEERSSQAGAPSQHADFGQVAGPYAGYVERVTSSRGDSANTIQVFNISTGEQAWQTTAHSVQTGMDGRSHGSVTALAVTYQGDAAWLIDLQDEGTELWVRDGTGSVHLGSDQPVDPGFLTVSGDTVSYRQDGQTRSITLNEPPVLNPYLRLGLRDGDTRPYAIPQGEQILIRLPTCEASCGYRWHRFSKPDPRVLIQTSTRLVKTSSGEVREYRYSAVGRGKTNLGLEYLPPGRNRAQKEFFIIVTVR